MDLFQLVAKLGLDTSEYERGIGKSKGMMRQLGSSVSASTIAMGNVIAQGINKAFDLVADLGKSAIQNAADIAAETAQFEAAFGELQAAANGAFNGIAKDTGILETRLKNVGTKAFSQFKGAGLDAVSALGQMDTYTRLAADAAAYYDMSLEDADTRLRSFLRGNTEAGDMIGLFTSETQRNNKALEVYGRKWLDLTEAQKQMLMLNIADEIYTQSGAIGQAQRESDGWTNVIGNLKEAWRQLTGVFGTPLEQGAIPFLQKLGEVFQTDSIQLRVMKISQWFGDIAGKAFEGAIDFLDGLLAWSNRENDEDFKINIDIPSWEEIQTTATEKLNGIVEGIKAATKWTLGTFTIEGMSIPDIVGKFTEWWNRNTMYDKLLSVAKYGITVVYPATVNGIVSGFTTFWTDLARPAIEAAAKFTLGEMLLPALFGENGIYTVFKNWWNKYVADEIEESTGWKLQLPELPSVDDMVAAISAWWETVKALIKPKLKFRVVGDVSNYQPTESVDEYTGKYSDLGLPKWDDGYKFSDADGIDYVPHDDYRTRLHRGETVLTRAQAEDYRAGNMGGIDYAALGAVVGEAVRAALDGMAMSVNDRVFGEIVTEKASRGIAVQMKKMRYVT